MSAVRTRNIFDPMSQEPFKLSRSKLEAFLNCPRCFYLDRRCGIGQPPMPAFTLNSAVDVLLKREFDTYRHQAKPHPLMLLHDIEAVPFAHPSLEQWRDNRTGVRHLHERTNFLVFGAIDDAWVTAEGELHVVDYKSTSSDHEVSLDGPWKEAYKRQAEIYQWLLRRNGFAVSDTAYFVYVNADKSKPSFNGKLEFSTRLLPYEGKDDWIDDALGEARLCLERSSPPLPHPECPWCAYRAAASTVQQ
ncbi:MAG: PD-(D/E)XK nuclease family protein [Candidatus Peribacteraceae bacterium]|nr:PD-(D/E)XK nuclease family protein [Candidatus Peribacteraceae bacterium]